jgi:hypothetical protein
MTPGGATSGPPIRADPPGFRGTAACRGKVLHGNKFSFLTTPRRRDLKALIKRLLRSQDAGQLAAAFDPKVAHILRTERDR